MGKGKIHIERRHHERLTLSFPVLYRLVDDSLVKTPAKEAKIGNISRSGVKLVAGEAIDVGAFLYVKIVLPDNIPPITGKARVVWQKKAGTRKKAEHHMGLHFKSIDGKGEDMVSHVVINILERTFELPRIVRK